MLRNIFEPKKDVLKDWTISIMKSFTNCSVPFLTEHHAIKAYWGSGGIVPRILDLRYPLDRRLSELQSRSGRNGEEKNSQLPPGIEP